MYTIPPPPSKSKIKPTEHPLIQPFNRGNRQSRIVSMRVPIDPDQPTERSFFFFFQKANKVYGTPAHRFVHVYQPVSHPATVHQLIQLTKQSIKNLSYRTKLVRPHPFMVSMSIHRPRLNIQSSKKQSRTRLSPRKAQDILFHPTPVHPYILFVVNRHSFFLKRRRRLTQQTHQPNEAFFFFRQ